jgi:tRNA threonylcarbamoyladenosine biosynthesis protein TsaE
METAQTRPGNSLILLSASEDETLQAGRYVAGALASPAVILLTGDLGAGKTAFTRGFVDGLGTLHPSPVHSPTFTLVNEYRTDRGKVYHVDLYRLDFRSVGLDEILESGDWVLVEWAEKLRLSMPDAIRVTLRQGPDDCRRIEITGLPPSAEAALTSNRDRAGGGQGDQNTPGSGGR